jgi:hypothetical protein
MPKYEIAIEYKSANVSRPVLHQTVGAAVHTRPEIDEVIVRCGRATRTARLAARDYNDRSAALKNRKGRNVRVTLAIGPVER